MKNKNKKEIKLKVNDTLFCINTFNSQSKDNDIFYKNKSYKITDILFQPKLDTYAIRLNNKYWFYYELTDFLQDEINNNNEYINTIYPLLFDYFINYPY